MSLDEIEGVIQKSENHFELTQDIHATEEFENLTLDTNTTLDGNNHTVSGLTNSMFRRLKANSTLMNLTFSECSITETNSTYMGLIARRSNKCTIKNITVINCEMNNSKLDYTGFICGHVSESTLYDITIEESDIEGDNMLGCVCGKVNFETNLKDITVSDCTIKGRKYIGGQIGIMRSSKATNLTISNTQIEGTSKVGGLMGSGQGEYKHCTVHDTKVKGDKLSGGFCGIVGKDQDSTTIEKCKSDCVIEGNLECGGFSSKIRNAEINQCKAKGKIIATSPCGFAEESTQSMISKSYCEMSLESTKESIGFIRKLTQGSVKNSFSYNSTLSKDSYISLISTHSGTEISNLYGNSTVIGTNPTYGESISATLDELKILLLN